MFARYAGIALLVVAATACKSRDQVRYYELNDRKLTETEQGRQFTKYLASCALAADVGAYAVVGGQRHEFPGKMGLAPEWIKRPLTEAEQHWVSACILARTNFFGVPVQISMRGNRPDVPALATSPGEDKEFPIHEADFFGNMFSVPAVGGLCLGPRGAGQGEAAARQKRVCTEVGTGEAFGKKLSKCAMVITGPCTEKDAHSIAGREYPFVQVFLKR